MARRARTSAGARRAAFCHTDCDRKAASRPHVPCPLQTALAAVGEPDNRFRKPAAPGRMIKRVMLLDAVLDDGRCRWLGPAFDKRRYFIRHLERKLDPREYPHLSFGDGAVKTVRYFPDKLPIGVHQGGLDHHVFVYLVTHPSPMDFRLFLLRHVPLLRVIFQWTIRLLFPRSLWKARLVYLHAAREHRFWSRSWRYFGDGGRSTRELVDLKRVEWGE
jgi:hypothetical protein